MGNTISYTNDTLVSVVVITYNSSATVLETLDSIANQTYNNLELIITDDYSRDDTVAICQNWIDNFSERFNRIKLITTGNNTGTSGNLNRGVKETRGIWVKPIAGDDKLLPNCISENFNYVVGHPDTDILFSKVRCFGDLNLLNGHQWFKYEYFKLSPKKFYEKLIQGNFLPAASAFINRNLYDRIGYYDESIPLLEDWPFWMKAGYNKCTFAFIDTETVEYRVQESVSLSKNVSERYLECESKALELSMFYKKKYSLFLWIIYKIYYNLKKKFHYYLNISNESFF